MRCPVRSRCPNEPPRSFIILERKNDHAGRDRDRKFNPLVLGEIQTAADSWRHCTTFDDLVKENLAAVKRDYELRGRGRSWDGAELRRELFEELKPQGAARAGDRNGYSAPAAGAVGFLCHWKTSIGAKVRKVSTREKIAYRDSYHRRLNGAA